MKSWFDVLAESGDLRPVNCDWCGKYSDQLYDTDEDIVCRSCLENEEWEEPEHGLTLAERNQ